MREVVLTIKSASHRLEDLEIPTDLSVTVKELKKLIQVQNPIHPDIRDQRLIYAGHLLEDSQTLEQVLLPNSEATQTSFTLHLACTSSFFQPQRQQPARQNTQGPIHNISKGPVLVPTPPTPSSAPSNVLTGIPAEYMYMHQYYLNQMMTYMTEWSQGRPYTFNWSNQNIQNSDTAENLYSNSADRVFSTSSDEGATTSITVGGNNPEVEVQVTAEIERITEVAQAQEAARAAAEAARLENAAQVAAAREDDDPPRDLIDWMYTFSRVALIFSVVYFYSNFTRFILVVVFSALVFILQRRPNMWNWRQPAVAPANAAAPEPVVYPAPQPAEDTAEPPGVPNVPDEVNQVNNEVNSPEVQDGSPESNPVELVPEAQEAARINPRDVTWTFLTTFFTSLIPEIPQN